MPADHRSALPRVPGIPWWGAALVAVVLTAIGVAYDAGSGDNALGAVFAVCYVLGCVAAVLAVRRSGVFTAVIQPPLILFVAVPFAYFIFHGSTFTGIKDTLINYGYPLIERFPLMFFTSATVLVIGLVRWYLGVAARRAGTAPDDESVVDAPEDVPDAAEADVSSASGRRADGRTPRSTRSRTARTAEAAALADPVDDETARAARRAARAGSARSSADATGSTSRRSRHARPPETEIIEPVRPRKRPAPAADASAEPRRRPRTGEPREREPREPRTREPRARDPRGREPRDREPRERLPRDREPRERAPRERRPQPPLDTRTGQDRYERSPRRERPEGYERPERPRRPRPADYERYEPPPTRTNGSSTHHPVSRVRYRGADDGESRTENRSRRPRHSAPDSWEYDV